MDRVQIYIMLFARSMTRRGSLGSVADSLISHWRGLSGSRVKKVERKAKGKSPFNVSRLVAASNYNPKIISTVDLTRLIRVY